MIFTISFLIFGVCRILIWLGIFSHFSRAENVEKAIDRLPIPVSIIVVVKNEYNGLRQLLPELLKQDYPFFEVIVVNDFSDDQSLSYLKSIDDSRLKIMHCDKDLPGKKYALSLGINAAANEAILLTDGDCIPASNSWIKNMVQYLSPEKDIVLGFGMIQKKTHFTGLLSRYDAIQTAVLYGSAAKMSRPYMGVGRNLLYRKSIYLKAGAYTKHESYISGDDDLQIQEMATSDNTAVCLDPSAFTYTPSKTTVKEWLRQKVRHVSVATAYKTSIKWNLVLYAFLHVGFVFMGLISLWYNPLLTLLGLLIFYTIVFPINLKNDTLLDERSLAYYFPLADVTFAFANPVILILSKISSLGKWK